MKASLQVKIFTILKIPQSTGLCFFWFSWLLPAIFRRGGFESAWVIALGLFPRSSIFLSYTRFVKLAVPVFAVLSQELRNSEIRYWLTAAAFGVVSLLLLFRPINFLLGGLTRAAARGENQAFGLTFSRFCFRLFVLIS